MNGQIDMFGSAPASVVQDWLDEASNFESRKLARRTDPATSHSAAARVREFRARHADIILEALRQFGPMTVDEIAKRTRLQSQQINKRTPELARAGLARADAGVRGSASGRPERIWRAL